MKPHVADCLTHACQSAVPGLHAESVRRVLGMLFDVDALIVAQEHVLAAMTEASNPRAYAQERSLLQMLRHLKEQDTAPHALAMACLSLLCTKPKLQLVKQ